MLNTSITALFAETLRNYYRSRGFFHTKVTYKEKDDVIEFVIEEQAPIIVSNIFIQSDLDIHTIIPFKKGEIFAAGKFDQSKKEIKLAYSNFGYCNTELEAKAWVDIETNLASLEYRVTPHELCYFGAINIIAPKNIDEKIIQSLLYITKGGYFSPEQITRSYKSLYSYEGISKAIIDTDVQAKDEVSINVTVTENEKPIRFQAGLGASSNEGAMISMGVKHRNFYNDLKTLSLSTRVTEIKKTVKSNFDMPLLNRHATGIELGYENESFLGFKEERVFSTVFLKQRSIDSVFKESVLVDSVITYDSEDKLLFPTGTFVLLSPKLEWSYDTRDNILSPTKGYFLRAELMGSLQSEVSDASYYKYDLAAGSTFSLEASVLAFKIDYGSLHRFDGDVPASYRFFAGGMNSNRAYAYRTLGPKNSQGDPLGSDSIMETTLEYRFPLSGDFKGVIFNDSTFLGSSEVPDVMQAYYCLGLGIRYMTPVGPIALDIGFDVANPSEQYAINFHIGELF